MNTFRKVLAVIVMIVSAAGVVLCVAGLIGAWVLNAPVKATATGALSSVAQYSMLAGQTMQTLDATVGDARRSVEDVNVRLSNLPEGSRAQFAESVRQQIDETIGPTLARATTMARTVWLTANGVNETLVSVNRLPGMNVPTFTNELDAVGAQLAQAQAALDEVRAAVAATEFDITRVQAATAKASSALSDAQARIAVAQTQIERVGSAIDSASAAVPGWVDGVSVIVTFLAILSGAGQVALFQAARRWLHNV